MHSCLLFSFEVHISWKLNQYIDSGYLLRLVSCDKLTVDYRQVRPPSGSTFPLGDIGLAGKTRKRSFTLIKKQIISSLMYTQ